jgi:RNA polymerase sigma factor (sigma-70 family)
MKQGSASSPQVWSVADLGAFFVENRSQFLAHARRVAGTSIEAEEIVQDSLVRVLLACPELESSDHALSYFHRVIENLSIDFHRRAGRQPYLVVLDEATSEVEAQWSVAPDCSDAISAANDAAIIREAISLLSPAERAALVMWEFEGRSTGEIAHALGIKESAVRHTLSRARAGLRRILSERVIDEERGLTALDVLSVSYRKIEKFAQKSSKLALSLIMIFVAFLGLSLLDPSEFVESKPAASADRFLEDSHSRPSPTTKVENPVIAPDESTGSEDSTQEIQIPKSSTTHSLSFGFRDFYSAGFDSEFAPRRFTVEDSLGNLGALFPGQPKVFTTETGLLLSGIVSTKSGATNVLINQSIVVDAFGTSYIAEVSVGINGWWQPLNLSVVSSDIERLASGNYLLTAIMMVDSAVETSIKVSTGTSGTDLSSAPEFVSTKLMLDPTKTKILAQAVLVSADSQGDGA